jgi:hypothetical protein
VTFKYLTPNQYSTFLRPNTLRIARRIRLYLIANSSTAKPSQPYDHPLSKKPFEFAFQPITKIFDPFGIG